MVTTNVEATVTFQMYDLMYLKVKANCFDMAITFYYLA